MQDNIILNNILLKNIGINCEALGEHKCLIGHVWRYLLIILLFTEIYSTTQTLTSVHIIEGPTSLASPIIQQTNKCID